MPTHITDNPPAVDAALVMNANYRFDATDRRYIDDQIRGCERKIVELVEDGTGGLVQTTSSDTPFRVKRYPIADGGILSLRTVVTVHSTDNSGDVAGEWEIKAAYTVVAGVLTEAYTPVITNLFGVGSPSDPTLTLNGNTDVDLNLVGIAATNLTWKISDFSL